MPGLSPQQSSFIPKRNSGISKRQPRQSTFFVLGIISFACLIAAPTASAAVYAYQLYVTKQFDASVKSLDQAITKFSDADINRVIEYNKRLAIIKHIVDSHISINRALEVLEANTAQSVAFNSLDIKRSSADTLTVKSDIITDSVDAAVFQRKTYTDLKSLASSTFEGVKFTPAKKDGTGRSVAFSGTLNFHASEVAFIPDGQQAAATPVATTTQTSEASTTVNTTTP